MRELLSRIDVRRHATPIVVALAFAALLGCGSSDETTTTTVVSGATGEEQAAEKPPPAPAERSLSAADTLKTYFRLLDDDEYQQAWNLLSSAVQRQFGGFGKWVGGYATSKSTELTQLEATSTSGSEAHFQVAIRAVDSGSCETAGTREFAGPWSLQKQGNRWVIIAASFKQISEQPAAGCEQAATVYFTDATLATLQEPAFVQIDNHDSVDGLNWQSWGEPEATGSGTLHHVVCEPNCAEGSYVSVPVTVTASDLADCAGKRQYRTLSISPTGEAPADIPATFSIPTYASC